MNIEELFDNEIYHNYGMLTTDDANLLINYLKTEVTEYVDGLRQRIAELEAQLQKVVKPVKLTYGSQYDGRCKCGKGMYYGVEHCTHCGAKLDWTEESK